MLSFFKDAEEELGRGRAKLYDLNMLVWGNCGVFPGREWGNLFFYKPRPPLSSWSPGRRCS